MGNWFQKVLTGVEPAGQQPPAQAPFAPGYYGQSPTQPQIPQHVPGTWRGYGTPVQQGYAPQMPGQQAPPGTPFQRPAQFTSFTADGAMTVDDGHVALLWDAAVNAGNSPEVRAAEKCPNCRKPSVITIDKDSRGNPRMDGQGRPKISRICMECNWPNNSSIDSGLISVRSSGPTKPARGMKQGHVVVAVDPDTNQVMQYAPNPVRHHR